MSPSTGASYRFEIARSRAAGARAEVRTLNGRPALVVDLPAGRPGEAPRLVNSAELDRAGRIRRFYTVLATRKLAAVAPLTA